MASTDEARLKQIRIKTGVVKRLTKEKSAYEKEVESQRQRVAKMKDQGEDEYVIKKAEEALQETKMMIPNSVRLLSSAVDDLAQILDSEKDLSENQIFKDADTALQEAMKILATSVS